jgi:hypothetical protein
MGKDERNDLQRLIHPLKSAAKQRSEELLVEPQLCEVHT